MLLINSKAAAAIHSRIQEQNNLVWLSGTHLNPARISGREIALSRGFFSMFIFSSLLSCRVLLLTAGYVRCIVIAWDLCSGGHDSLCNPTATNAGTDSD